MTQGGPTIPVTVSSDSPTGEPALRVTGSALAPAGTQGGPALPVVLISAAQVAAGYPVQGNAPVPMTLARDGRPTIGQRPIPVYVVSGTLYTYQQRLAATAPANLIAYWPLNEASGAMLDASGNGRNGTYSNVTLGAQGAGDGNTAASFNGSTSFANAYTAGLAGAFGSAEGTLAAWMRVSSAGVWTDSTLRRIATLQADGNNRVLLQRPTANNQLQVFYVAGGTSKSVTITTGAETTWLHLAITWSKAADQVKAYLNGAQQGATQTSLGTWAGSLAPTTTLLGAASQTPTSVWSGTLAHVALWSTPLSAAQIAALAVV